MSNRSSEKPLNAVKQAIVQIGAGGSAGFIEVCMMHPMDIIKTRFQLQVKTTDNNPMYYTVMRIFSTVDKMLIYTGMRDCMRKIYLTEGLAAFWKGILPPIIAETPKRALKFFTFEQYKKIFSHGLSSPTPVTFALAGFCAGITEGIVVNPFEVVKVRLQSNRTQMKYSPSTLTVTKEIIQESGFTGFNKGLSATALRNAIFNSCYFGFYHSIKSLIPVNKDPWIEFLTKVSLGFMAGTLASCLNIPFDVVKSRIQGPQGSMYYKGTLNTFGIVYRQEGLTALYKGLLPKVLRLGPGGAIMLVVYDYMHEFLTEQIR